jgi:hypothetical protein
LLIAPVLAPGGNREVYLPPGQWRDFFSGKRYPGGTTFTAHYAIEETPVFVRDGAIVPEQSASEYSDARLLDRLSLTVYGSGNGSFDLYEDDGASLDYEAQQAHTLMTHTVSGDGAQSLLIEPTQGAYPGQPPARSYELRIYAAGKPSSISVNGRETAPWSWDAARNMAVVELQKSSIRDPVRVEWH